MKVHRLSRDGSPRSRMDTLGGKTSSPRSRMDTLGGKTNSTTERKKTDSVACTSPYYVLIMDSKEILFISSFDTITKNVSKARRTHISFSSKEFLITK